MEGTSIAVLAMNRPETLRQTLDTIKATAVQPYEVIVVDNGSTDQATLDLLREREQEGSIQLIANDENLGLSIGTNQGLQAGKYDTLIHMDDDCVIKTNGWNLVLRHFLQRPEVGMAVPGIFGEHIPHEGGYAELRWGLGMCWGITKDLFDDIGGYDPQLHHQNECDMGLRVRMAGYNVAGIVGIDIIHNDPGGPRSAVSLGRERIGCVQFRDKWCSYFRNRNWTYGTDPIYLMQHWPPDQEFLRRWAMYNGVNLNPAREPQGQPEEYWHELDDHFRGQQLIEVQGQKYLVYRELRNDYMHWEWQHNPGAYIRDREQIIKDWHELTGELYTGYVWPVNLLKPY